MSAIRFGSKLTELYFGSVFSQLTPKKEDDLKMYQGKKIPLSVTFSNTHRCNLVCSHCQSENSDTADDISTKRILEIVDEVADAGCLKLGFTGGEPLLRKDMPDVLQKCYDRKLVTTLVSNSFPVFRYIKDLRGLSLLFLSLDGNREVNDQIRGKKSFDKFLEAVHLAKENNIPVAALTTVSAMNMHVIEDMCQIIEDLNIHWLVGVIQTQFTGLHEQNHSQQQLQKMVQTISKVKNLRTSKSYLDFVLGKRSLPKCFAGIGYTVISPEGKIFPCFPAQFDKAYPGISILDKNFKEAFDQLPLYRNTCDTCQLACHIETNYLYLFKFDNIYQSYKLTKVI